MGYIKHNAIIVTDWKEGRIKEAHEKARQIFAKHFASDEGESLVSPLVYGIANGQASFFIAPDDSKEGWDTSNEGDAARKEFLDYLSGIDGMIDYVEVRFGGDDEHERIERSNNIDKLI